MEQAVEQRGHGRRIAQELAPVLDGPVRSEDCARDLDPEKDCVVSASAQSASFS